MLPSKGGSREGRLTLPTQISRLDLTSATPVLIRVFRGPFLHKDLGRNEPQFRQHEA
jgi:hypothetical protein